MCNCYSFLFFCLQIMLKPQEKILAKPGVQSAAYEILRASGILYWDNDILNLCRINVLYVSISTHGEYLGSRDWGCKCFAVAFWKQSQHHIVYSYFGFIYMNNCLCDSTREWHMELAGTPTWVTKMVMLALQHHPFLEYCRFVSSLITWYRFHNVQFGFVL